MLAASSVRVLEVTHWLPSMVAALEDELSILESGIVLINLRQPGAVQVGPHTAPCCPGVVQVSCMLAACRVGWR